MEKLILFLLSIILFGIGILYVNHITKKEHINNLTIIKSILIIAILLCLSLLLY